MDREDVGILTTTMDGIITAMNVMSDQINNHTTMVVNELKDQREKNTKFMEKVDAKLLQMKKDLQQIHKDIADPKQCQNSIERIESYVSNMIPEKIKSTGDILHQEMVERAEKK